MGIPFLFRWIINNIPRSLQRNVIKYKKRYTVDYLGIDLNAVIHKCCQKVFKYGAYAELPQMKPNTEQKEFVLNYTIIEKAYKEVCSEIDKIVSPFFIKRDLIISIDGLAPRAKQQQQRQRRYRSMINGVVDGPTKGFDSNSISIGTTFLRDLSKYIESHIMHNYKHINVVFSNERTIGEGEHKIIRYLKKHARKDNVCCIHGLDADLIVLGLSTHIKNFYILRDNEDDYDMLDLLMLREYLHDHMKKDIRVFGDIDSDTKDITAMLDTLSMNVSEECNEKLIDDFVLLSFLFGNDFLPNSPSLEILDGGIDDILEIYHETDTRLTYREEKTNSLMFDAQGLKKFLINVQKEEERLLINRTVPDELIDLSYEEDEKGRKFSYTKYMKLYNLRNIPKVKKASKEYLRGFRWVLIYYTSSYVNNEDWGWYYPYHHAPFVLDIIKEIDSCTPKKKNSMHTYDNLFQLLCILPPHSNNLIPPALQKLHLAISKLDTEIEVDKNGKRYDWQYIIKLPIPKYDEIYDAYKSFPLTGDDRDLNMKEKSKYIRKEYEKKRKIQYIDI